MSRITFFRPPGVRAAAPPKNTVHFGSVIMFSSTHAHRPKVRALNDTYDYPCLALVPEEPPLHPDSSSPSDLSVRINSSPGAQRSLSQKAVPEALSATPSSARVTNRR